MHLKDFISHTSSLNDRSSLLHYLKDNISKIEYSFYNSSFKELDALKFDIDDYCCALIPLLEKNESQKVLNAFTIILGDYYDRFLLVTSIAAIYDYVPKSSVKNRLKVSKRYLQFNNLDIDPYNESLNEMLDLLEDAFLNDDMGYRSMITLSNLIYSSKNVLEQNYKTDLEKFLGELNNQKENYQVLKALDQLIDNAKTDSNETAKERSRKVQEDVTDESIPKKVDSDESVLAEESKYAEAYYKLAKKNMDTIRSLNMQFHQNNDEDYRKLERGTAVIHEFGQLYQYIFSLGRMHKAKLDASISTMPWQNMRHGRINLIDWGCGQGIGSICLNDYFAENKIDITIDTTVLIEPSLLALRRAVTHVQPLKFTKDVKAVNKDLDSINIVDFFDENSKNSTVHVFSNILDFPGFEIHGLFEKIKESLLKSKVENWFIIVSPSIDDLRDQRVETFYDLFYESFNVELISNRKTPIRKPSNGYWSRNEKVFIVKF
jgi:hypothetical protein